MTPRRHLEIAPLGCALSVALAFAAGVAISIKWPMGFAPELPSRVAGDDRPRPGLVLTAGRDSALVYSGSTFAAADGSRIGAVIWLRGGRSGREALRVTGCAEGAGQVESLTDAERRGAWRAASAEILSMVARAICHTTDTEPERQAPPGIRSHHAGVVRHG